MCGTPKVSRSIVTAEPSGAVRFKSSLCAAVSAITKKENNRIEKNVRVNFMANTSFVKVR